MTETTTLKPHPRAEHFRAALEAFEAAVVDDVLAAIDDAATVARMLLVVAGAAARGNRMAQRFLARFAKKYPAVPVPGIGPGSVSAKDRSKRG